MRIFACIKMKQTRRVIRYAVQMPEELKKWNRIEYQYLYLLFELYSTAFAFTGFRESAGHSIDM
jgi:hypothetical protein